MAATRLPARMPVRALGPGASRKKEFTTLKEFKEFLTLLVEPETRKATLAMLANLPYKELGSAELSRLSKASETKVIGAATTLKNLGLVTEPKPGRFRAVPGFALSADLQRQLAALSMREQEDLIRLHLESQRENLNSVCEFWKMPGNPSGWISKSGRGKPNLSFGITHIPASAAADVSKAMAKFEDELSRLLDSKANQRGDKEVNEPLLLVQWLLVPVG